jgi:hypothetical protein
MPPLGMGKEAAAMRRAILSEATKQWKAMGISPGEANVIAAQNKSGLAELGRIADQGERADRREHRKQQRVSQVLSLLGSAARLARRSSIRGSRPDAGRRATARFRPSTSR